MKLWLDGHAYRARALPELNFESLGSTWAFSTSTLGLALRKQHNRRIIPVWASRQWVLRLKMSWSILIRPKAFKVNLTWVKNTVLIEFFGSGCDWSKIQLIDRFSMNFAPVTGSSECSSVCTIMRILQRQRSGQGRRYGLEGHKYQNSVPARTLRSGISVKMYPSSCD